MSWQLSVLVVLALVLLVGAAWFERSRPSARILAAVAALAALGIAGRVLLAPIPNVVATTDVVLLAGYTLGAPAGFAVGALSALVSNFWLGQGPWTPWQMAGWGLVGIGGAGLALLSARRLGRKGLAIAAAIAGLLYGALLDLSAMVNFGGEQSLDRYLALSARGIPFNIAHAFGNAALMLAAGPAIVRMLDRYRERFEVRWLDSPAEPAGPRGAGGPAPLPGAAGLLALAVGLAIAGGTLISMPASGAEASASAVSSQTRSWLVGAQNADGGYGIAPGSSSSPGMTGWAMLGLEAAGRNPRDLGGRGPSPVDYLRKHVGELSSTGDLERTILALKGAGVSSSNFGGRNLLADLRSRQNGNGSYEKQVNLTAFAILARSAGGEGSSSLSRSGQWLRDAQNKDGGWASVSKGASEPDSTGSALQALALVSPGSSAIRDGARWLEGAQRKDGGWSLTRGAASNSQSTAWAIQGLAAAGAGAAGIRNNGNSGLDFLAGRRRGDGHYTYSRSSDQTPVWVTAQAISGAAQDPYPIPPVARKPQRTGGGEGDGGNSGNTGSGFGAGGGGSAYGDRGGGSGGGPGAGGSAGGGSGKANGGSPDRERISAGGEGLTSPLLDPASGVVADDSAGDSSLPSTPVLLAALGLLGGLLVAGWFVYRRNLP